MRLLLIVFLALSVGSYSQNSEEVLSIQKQIDESSESMELKFENKKDIDSAKMSLFTKRLEEYYQELDKIEYLSHNDSFILYFNRMNVDQEKITDILTHFDIYNFEYK
ncbi:MAG: hypothetical protein WED10_12895 [Brumimicrobium sp.]